MTDEPASLLFHSLKYSKSIKVLKVSNAKFNVRGFKELANCIKETNSLSSIYLEDLNYLGALVCAYIKLD
jgi:Ran GTPase-activating protein (RanGAP) involved in mRNA processing and transport